MDSSLDLCPDADRGWRSGSRRRPGRKAGQKITETIQVRMHQFLSGLEDPVLGKKNGSGALYLKRREVFKNSYLNNLDSNFWCVDVP